MTAPKRQAAFGDVIWERPRPHRVSIIFPCVLPSHISRKGVYGQLPASITTLVLATIIECGAPTSTRGSNGNVGSCSTDFQVRMWCESAISRTATLTAQFYDCANKLLMMTARPFRAHTKIPAGQTERNRVNHEYLIHRGRGLLTLSMVESLPWTVEYRL